MKMRAFVWLMSVTFLVFVLASPAQAIVVCYDYVYYRLTEFCEGKGTDPAPLGGAGSFLGYGTVVQYLQKNRYSMPLGVNRPIAGNQLKRGDVIVIPGHIGFVNGPDNIDHFLQVQGALGMRYQVSALPMNSSGRRGGLFKGHTLKQFLDRPSSRQAHFQVWRRDEQPVSWAGQWRITWASGAATLTLNATGNSAQGTYTFANGRVKGQIQGDTLSGTWNNSVNGGSTDSFKWTLAKDGQSFKGAYQYQGASYWWNGTRIK